MGEEPVKITGDEMKQEYSSVTELPGNKVTQDQLNRLFHRYHFASKYCQGKDVLEVACGGGMGLGYIAKVAKKVVGGDIDEDILKLPINHYKDRKNIELKNFDAQSFPFLDKSFDVVVFYEAIYYLNSPELFIEEASRVLRKGGTIIICSVNKNWADFNPSPYSFKYFSVPELLSILNKRFSSVEVFGAFPVINSGFRYQLTSFIKRLAVKFNLMPKTMKGKKIFKRIFMGKLIEMPYEIRDENIEYEEPALLPDDKPTTECKVLYAVGR